MDGIFGKREGNVRIEGLVDVTIVDDFDHKLDSLEKPWITLESPYAGNVGPQFHSYVFQTYSS